MSRGYWVHRKDKIYGEQKNKRILTYWCAKVNFKTSFGSTQNIPFETLVQKLRHWYK